MRFFYFVLAFMAAMPRIGLADDKAIQWKEVGGWTVAVDPTLDNGCFVLTSFDDDTIFRLGFNFRKKDKPLYILLGNPNWKSLEKGKHYPIELSLDQTQWTADARGLDLDGLKSLWIDTDDTDLIEEFSGKLSFRARFNGKEIAALGLKDSERAADELLACQKAVNDAVMKQPAPPQSKDPFEAKPGTQASDPFDL
ncbi:MULTISPECIES: hypothetical protein [Rhizobium]|uniref:Uncharacterized protein n=1 Tax=Rhizobium changzhiense TaxID=2692317 RepID=A0A7Z0RFT4_9HYPH|nr:MULTISPECIES: hypothetical protein [Rhizobium]MCV9944443.1 hypothetical protein [Rhizobium sp. BT-175]MCW0018008.1 hypothetical protein [Rhizobium sp. BT-226]NZD60711.1 hypothetical protein [Rhizobium changzhiense]